MLKVARGLTAVLHRSGRLFRLGASSCFAMASFDYPLARRDETIVDDYHGHKINDPYRWLEDPDSEATKEYVQRLNAISVPFLEGYKFRENIRKRLTELWDYPREGCLHKEGDYYFYSYNSGLQNQSVVYIKKSLTDEGKVFFDPNLLSDDGTTSISATTYTEDGTLMAYGLSEKGSDWVTVKFKRVPSGEDLPDKLEQLRYSSLSFTHDGRGLFYNMFPAHKEAAVGTCTTKNEYHSMYYHKLGTSQSEDILCVDFPDHPEYMQSGYVTKDGQYLISEVTRGCDPTNLLFYYEMSSNGGVIKSKLNLKTLIGDFEAKFNFVTNDGPLFTILTDYKAPLFKLIQIDIRNPSKENWRTLVEEDKHDKLDWAMRVKGDKLVLCYMKDVKNVMHVHSLKTGARTHTFPLDIGTVVDIRGKEKSYEVFFMFQSFLTPGIIYRCDMSEEKPVAKEYKRIQVRGIDSNQFETKQVFYSSKDGTKVPMYILHKQGLPRNGDNACVLYGYGGFNVPILPYFSLSRLMFMQHFNGVCAVANIRGGSEYGEKWHQEGMKENKQNVFDDFVAAAEYLIEQKYTSTKKLAIEGGSNGGLLVGACANQRPDLFGCVVNHVGVLDMFRYHNFTIGQAWVPEYGCATDAEAFEILKKYSPLHNLHVPRNGYPAMLLLTADHDDRVVPLHSLKYTAQLYHLVKGRAEQKNPLLIRIETKAGHGAGKPTSKIINELTDVYSFIARIMNLEWKCVTPESGSNGSINSKNC